MTTAGDVRPGQRGFFVTGTDTGVGKTLVTAALLLAATDRGEKSLGLKPVAAGWSENEAVNPDVLEIQASASIRIDHATINPVSFERPVAPHIAAAESGTTLSVERLARHCRGVCADNAPDFIVVEGAGGWLVPLNADETMADFCQALGFPIIVVVGMRLGCLNHALLTVQSVAAAGLPLAGWVANRIEPDMPAFDENLETLRERIVAPLIGIVPYLDDAPSARRVAGFLHPELLNGAGE